MTTVNSPLKSRNKVNMSNIQRIILTRANFISYNLQAELAALYAQVLKDYEYPYKSKKSRKKLSQGGVSRQRGTRGKTAVQRSKQSTARAREYKTERPPSNNTAEDPSTRNTPAATETSLAIPEPTKSYSASLAVESSSQECPPELTGCLIHYRRSEAWQQKVEGKFKRLKARHARKEIALNGLARAQGVVQNDVVASLKHLRPENKDQERLIESFTHLEELLHRYSTRIDNAKRGISIAAKIIADNVFKLYGQSVPPVENFVERASSDGLSSEDDGRGKKVVEREIEERQLAGRVTPSVEMDAGAEAERRKQAAAQRRARAMSDLAYMEQDFQEHWFSYEERLAQWKENHGDTRLTEFQIGFLEEGQEVTRNLKRAEDQYSAAATEARKLHAWAWPDAEEQSSRFPSDDSVDSELLREENEYAIERTNKGWISTWQNTIHDRGDPTLPGSQILDSHIQALKGVVVGETPWEFADGRRRRHIEKWNDRRTKAWKSMKENWQECTYDQKHQAEVPGPPDARPDSPPRSAEKAESGSDCGVVVSGRSLRYSTKRQRRSR